MDEPSTSNDPQDVTYSYQVPNNPSLWGPYCYQCMNRWYRGKYIHTSISLYLHTWRCALPYSLEKLIETNGTTHPFTLLRLDEPLRRHACRNEKCRRDRSCASSVCNESIGHLEGKSDWASDSAAPPLDEPSHEDPPDCETISTLDRKSDVKGLTSKSDSNSFIETEKDCEVYEKGNSRDKAILDRREAEGEVSPSENVVLETPPPIHDVDLDAYSDTTTPTSSIISPRSSLPDVPGHSYENNLEAECEESPLGSMNPLISEGGGDSGNQLEARGGFERPEPENAPSRNVPRPMIQLLTAQSNFGQLQTNAYQEGEVRHPTVIYNHNAREDEELGGTSPRFSRRDRRERSQDRLRPRDIALRAPSIESCSSALEELEVRLAENPGEESDCGLSPHGVTVNHMHLISTEPDHLSKKQLKSLAAQYHKNAVKGTKCFKSKYGGLKPFCVPTCYVCGFTATCCCDYALHVFGETHISLLNAISTPVSRMSFNFWIHHLTLLRQKSKHHLAPFEVELHGPPTLKVRANIPHFPLTNFQRSSHPPVTCRLCPPSSLSGSAGNLRFMNASSNSRNLSLERTFLCQLAQAVYLNYSSSCFSAQVGCPFIRHYCPQVCPLCFYKSRCACRFIVHLFGPQHISALNKSNIKVTLNDMHFWLRHLEAFSNRPVNSRMRPILHPLTSISEYIAPSEYPNYLLPHNHSFHAPLPQSTDNSCMIS